MKQKGNGFFIYMCEYGNLSQIKRQFLQSLASSLKKTGSQGVMQWQELAAALVNRATGKEYPVQRLIEQFPKLLAQRPQIVNQLTTKISSTCPEIDNPYIIKAVVWMLSPAHAPFAANWLSGRELSDDQAKMMDLPNSSKDDKDSEAFSTARQILDLVGYYTTPVICFDELDGTELADDEDPLLGGFTRAQVVASLGKDIYNSLKRGLLLYSAYEKTWSEEFKSLSTATAVKDRIAHQEISLTSLKADDVVLLVGFWLEQFYSHQNLTPPHPIYPFDEKTLRDTFGGQGAGVRDVLRWCAENFGTIPIDRIEQLEVIYQDVLSSLEIDLDDNEKIANALAFCLTYLRGQTIENVTLKSIDREVKPKYRHKDTINFRILGEEDGKPVKIGVCVLQNSNGHSVGAGIKYLTLYKDLDFTRGCLVRGKTISKRWQVANTHLDLLLNKLGGEWVSLKEDEVKPLLVLHTMSKNLDGDVFSYEDFQRFLCEKHSIQDNLLLREILSDPSGQVPEEITDEDNELEKAISEVIISETSDELDDLDLLDVA
ncbi:MAG: hypothetical protein KME15_05690 [Drouetiella hepatica Uher 2000/2452]|uniref:Uncharacterized protein n=1 Tax=Drouetiella hepatica Uher 2000/2452 TaxID=904376 RepID=A0A951ULD4_9CYAN|nr:hypothetical protein [Drouetiella hepatica Uher 2000/2452]